MLVVSVVMRFCCMIVTIFMVTIHTIASTKEAIFTMNNSLHHHHYSVGDVVGENVGE